MTVYSLCCSLNWPPEFYHTIHQAETPRRRGLGYSGSWVMMLQHCETHTIKSSSRNQQKRMFLVPVPRWASDADLNQNLFSMYSEISFIWATLPRNCMDQPARRPPLQAAASALGGSLWVKFLHWRIPSKRGGTRVYLTVGNRSGLTGYRSNRTGPVPVWSGMKPVQI